MHEANPFLSIQLEAVELQQRLAGIDLVTSDLGFVLHARRRLAGSRNRRKLFSVFDDFFSNKIARGAVSSETLIKGPVSLTRVSFRNWKVFANIDLELPPLEEDRPVVLIGGNNGYGKTSFLEGILFCLFGRAAHAERARLLEPDGQTSTGQRAAGYEKFLARAFHRPARARGETTMVVRTEWQTVEGPLCVERRWYLGEDEVSVDDEVLMLWGGEDRDVVDVPEDEEASQYYQSEIERRLLSAGAASFMLFDAEQVHWFSERGVDDQVRLVTERSFGLSEWKEAAADLRDYARDRGRRIEKEVGAYDDQRRLLQSFQHQLDELDNTAAALEREGAVQRSVREASFAQIASLDQSSYETLQSLLERRQLLTAEHGRLSHEFASAASAVLPVAVIGKRLRGAIAQSLVDDRNKVHEGFEVFGNERILGALVERLRSQPLKPGDGVENTISQLTWAWEKLAAEKAEAADLRYPFLTTVLRDALLARLHKHRDDLGRVRSVSETLAALSTEMMDLNLKIDQAKARSEAITRHENELLHIGYRLRELENALSELSTNRSKISTEQSQAIAMFDDDFGPAAADQGRVIRDALSLADAIEDAARALLPPCFEKVASALTENYLALSHKDVVREVRISVSGQVELLDHAGNDLRSIEGSAGEKQIFAMALLTAISEFAPSRLPSIIDTPLGRLDPDHRQRLLRFFSSRPIQTIMLSQPNEINGTTLQLIYDRVAARFLLEHKADPHGLGASGARKGYFEEVAA